MLVAESQARLSREVGGRQDRVDSLKHGRQRGGAARFDRALVHRLVYMSPICWSDRTGTAVGHRRDRFDDRAQIGLDGFGDFSGGGERDALIRHHRAIDPPAVHEPVEIVLGPCGTIERREVETGLERGRLREGERAGRGENDARVLIISTMPAPRARRDHQSR